MPMKNFVLILLGVICSPVFAQVQIGPPVRKPITACPSVCIPNDVDGHCDAGGDDMYSDRLWALCVSSRDANDIDPED